MNKLRIGFFCIIIIICISTASETLANAAFVNSGHYLNDDENDKEHRVPGQPSVINGPDRICPGSNIQCWVEADPEATSYTWTLPEGWTGASSGSEIYITAGTDSGEISVTANNSSGSSKPRTLFISVIPSPEPVKLSGPTTVCQGSTHLYTLNDNPEIKGYNWMYSEGVKMAFVPKGKEITFNTSSHKVIITIQGVIACDYVEPYKLEITILPEPSVSLPAFEEVCIGAAPITLSEGKPSGGIYSGEGVAEGKFDPSLAGKGRHTLTYTYTDENNCSASNSSDIEVAACTGTEEAVNDKAAVVSPNPFSEEAVVKLANFSGSGDGVTEIYNGSGVKVKSIDGIHSGEVTIHREQLPEGIYFYQVFSDKKIVARGKFIIEN